MKRFDSTQGRQTLVLILLLLKGLCGCTSFDEANRADLATIESSLPARFSAIGAQSYGELRTKTQQSLFDLFGSKMFSDLVREALANNADLNAAARRLESSRLLVRQVTAQQLPRADASINSGRIKNGGKSSRSHSGSVAISWELDLWGRLADQSIAAQKNYDVAEKHFLAARNSIASQAARRALLLWALDEVYTIEKKRVLILQNLMDTTSKYYREGLTEFEDVGVINIELESARAELASLVEQYRSAQRDLEVLLGRYPEASIQWDQGLPDIKNPDLIVPAAVLAERPDIQAAFSLVIAHTKETDAAYKALLPSITLGSTVSRLSDSASLADISAWSLVAGITQPLFQGGILLAEAQASSSKAEAAVFDYKQTVLLAMQEVEGALSLDRSLANRYGYYQIAASQAESVLKDYTLRYRNGLIGILELLHVQQQTLDLRSVLVQMQAARLDNRIVLGLALGLGVLSAKEQQP